MRMREQGRRGRSVGSVLGLLCLALLLPASPAGANFDCGTALSSCQVQLDNSGRAWFTTTEKLTEDALGDGTLKNGVFQIYKRAGNQTLLVSKRPDGTPIAPENKQNVAAYLRGVSPDGERVYIQTEASLVPEDGDAGHEGGSGDGYLLSGGGYSLFTTGPLDGPAPNPNPYAGSQGVWASDDGRYVYFETAQALVPEDWDNYSDIYQRADGLTRLVSIGPDEYLPTQEFPDPRPPEMRFLGASPDGATAYFATAAHLTADEPGKSPSEGSLLTSDIFSWRDGTLQRVTRTVSPTAVPGTPWESFDPYSFAIAGNGSAYFAANSGHVPEDTDQNRDVYRAKPDGSLERVISSPPGASPMQSWLSVEAASRDGSRLFLRSGQQLVPADRDNESDIYMWSAGSYELISPKGDLSGALEEELELSAISGDGHRAYFKTWASLSPQDSDKEPDVYEWSDGTIRLVSPASDGKQSAAFFSGISPNGRFVAFSTYEELVPGDNDTKQDIYVIDMGADGGASASISRAGAQKNGARRGKRRKLRLVTAEAIAPKMKVGQEGSFDGETAWLKLRCPKKERSGPCHGKAKLFSGQTGDFLASGSFRIARAHRGKVAISGPRLDGYRGPLRGMRVRVRGVDQLGNTATVEKEIHLQRSGGGKRP
ncbi:MAG: hypothetical protein WD827_08230 [Solirubrobacterales bacterium]